MEYERAIEYRELLQQCAENCAEAEDYGYRLGKTETLWLWRQDLEDAVVQVFFVRGWQTDRQRSFLSCRLAQERRPRARFCPALSNSSMQVHRICRRELMLQEELEDMELAGRMADRKTGA